MSSANLERSPSATSQTEQDLALLEQQNFHPFLKAAIQLTIISLNHLKEIAAKLGVPIEQITAEQIIKEYQTSPNQIADFAKLQGSIRPSQP